MAVSVYKLRMFDATTSAGVTKVKHIKMVTPAPFEVVDRMPAAKKLPIEDISKVRHTLLHAIYHTHCVIARPAAVSTHCCNAHCCSNLMAI